MTILGEEGSADALVALGRDLGLPPASLPHSSAALQAECEQLWAELLPATAAEFTATPLSFAFLACCSRYASRAAYRIEGRWITWAECARRVAELADRVQRRLPAPDQAAPVPVVAAMMHNSAELMELFYAAALGHFSVLPVNYRLSAIETDVVLETAAASLLLTSSELMPKCAALDWYRSNSGKTMLLEQLGTSSLDPALPRQASPQRPQSSTATACLAEDRVVEVFATSGSTGAVKLVPHTDRAVLTHALATKQALGLAASDEHCWAHVGPMFHVGDIAFVWVGLLIGCRHAFLDNQLQLTALVETFASQGVTITKLAPAMLALLTESAALEGHKFPALRWVLTGGAKLNATLAKRAHALLGCEVRQGYGMTEATCHIAFKNETREPPDVGLLPLPGLEVRVMSESGAIARVGEVGEIVLRGPTVTRGYQRAGQPELDRTAFLDSGFLCSGDLGFLCGGGRLHVVGRLKDMINVGGENVFAAEVEAVVAELVGAAHCGAFALPDRLLGEVVAVAIEGADSELDVAAIRRHCRAKLASYKVPKEVFFLPQLPRTASGKIRKNVLAELCQPAAVAAASTAAVGGVDAVALSAFLNERIGQFLGSDTHAVVTDDANILELGVDSLNVIDLLLELEQRCGVTLPPTLLYDCPTIRAIVAYLVEHAASAPASSPPRAFDETAEPGVDSTSTSTSAGTEHGGGLGMLATLLQGFGLVVRPTLLALSSMPVLILAIRTAEQAGVRVALALSPVWITAHLILAMVLTAAVVRLLEPRAARFPLWSVRYCRWVTTQNLLRGQEEVLGLLRGTAVLAWYYRLLGARIGRRVRIHSLGLTDPRFLSIEVGAEVGRDAVLQPSTVSRSAVSREPITIGAGAVIGPGAQLVGEVTVPAGGAVRALGTATAPANGSEPVRTPGVTAASYLAATYVYGLSVGAGLLLVSTWTAQGVAALPTRLAAIVFGESALRGSELVAVAIALQWVLPMAAFATVVGLVRPVVVGLERAGALGAAAGLYRSVIEVPFFAVWLRMTVMSPLAGVWYRLLGARIGRRTMLAGPYVEAPRHLEIGDGGVLAGNVTVLNAPRGASAASRARVDRNAIVANSCVLTAGAVLPSGALLGDLSALSGEDRVPLGSIAVGSPPRVVGRSRFHDGAPSVLGKAAHGLLLGPAQLLASALVAVASMAAFGVVLQVHLLPGLWNVALILPIALLARRLVRLIALIGFKWAVVGRVKAGEHPLFGGFYARWVFLEALIMDAERSILVSLRGTPFLALLWRLLGARIGPRVCLMGSTLGCEFDLKTVGQGAVLQSNAMVFAHSVEHHSLLFRATRIGADANVGPNAIVEAGADVFEGQQVPANLAVHARPTVTSSEPADAAGGDPLALEALAKDRLPSAVFAYFSNGSQEGRALRRNLEVLKALAICPRRLRDVSAVRLNTTLFGRELASPILVAPSAMHRLLHADGEMAMARAVARRNAGMVLSMLSTTPLEQVAGPFDAGQGLALFQLYMLKDRGLTDALVQRAEAAGYDGLVVTVDSPASGRIDIDPREWLRFSQALDLVHLPVARDSRVPPLVRFESMKDPSLQFSDLAALQAKTRLPICLKGILSPFDAVLAASLGFKTIILSNHGGRRLDDEVSGVEMVTPVRLALERAGHDIRLLVDGGIRNGTDVFKAIALGADGVLVGRAPLWGLAASGESGVTQVLQRLDEELVVTMKLAGCASVAELTPDLLRGHWPDRMALRS